MLKSLNIENIAVIEKCNIDFSCGFNVLTGETGAGKSIVIDAINAVTGERTSKELVRSGCEKATVSAVFEDIGSRALEVLGKYGITADDGSIMLFRSITSDGRNTCKVNGMAINVAVLREIGTELVNIHGQHDSQALLCAENHRGFIDGYGNYGAVIGSYTDTYRRLKAVKKQLKELRTDENEKQRTVDLLKYQTVEIEAAKVTSGELDELKARRELIRNAEKLRLIFEGAHLLLSGDDVNAGAVSLAEQASASLSSTSEISSEAASLTERLTASASELSDITAELRSLCDSVSFDAGELEQIEERIDVLNGLCRKYGGTEQAVLDYFDDAVRKLSSFENCDETVIRLESESDALEDELIKKGEILTAERKKSALSFSSSVCSVLKYLEMPNVVFSADFRQGIYTVNGCDDIEFLISANSGQLPKPLAKIASGGELSRIMLAIKSVMSVIDDTDTLIFDEIDTGISGRAADKVGRQMKSLATKRQIICVTHLAQIAASADNHLLISKSVRNNNTYTNVEQINGDRRVAEIARIMSGGEITENLCNSAKELIENHN